MENENTYKNIKKLFQYGAIKVSNFGKITTASHYVQNSLKKCKEGTYLFSGIPLRQEDKELIEAMESAFSYSDPSKLDVFLEDSAYEKKNIELLQRYTRMMLFLSVFRPGNHPPKTGIRYNFTACMTEKILAVDSGKMFKQNEETRTYYKEAVQLLRRLNEEIPEKDKNNRSYWVDSVKAALGVSAKGICMAEAIIHICYNYTMKESIADISKHYEEGNMQSFEQDYSYRLESYWNEFEQDLHKLPYEESNEWKDYKINFPKWDTAERIVAADKGVKRRKRKKSVVRKQQYNSGLYETNLKQERRKWNGRRVWLMIRQILHALLYVAAFCLIDLVMGNVEDIVSKFLDGSISTMNGVLVFVINALIFTVLFGIVSSLISVIAGLPDILECLGAMGNCFRGAFRMIKSPRKISYCRREE